jgi:sterol desaturase/sphingolipid hydroxylase (fatty acid hydroxylase superfamily)
VNLIDLATPGFFAAMGIEHRVLKKRAAAGDSTAVGYERKDTIASLLMGTASLYAPLAITRALAPIQPGKGKARIALVATALGAAAVTTAADVLADRDDDSRLTQWAKRVRPSSGVAAVATGIVVGSTGWAARTSARRIWERSGSKRDLGTGIAATAGALLAWDFIYYWNHRIQHESRWLWAIHVVHHSSEHYNLSTALRQPVADVFGMFVPYGLMAYLGFRPSVIETARALNLIYQFWIHTETIERMGVLEEVLNTPSHHRAHHGSNRQYLDRNHAGILIIWDRLFGTFEREREKVVYGLTTNINTFNPLRIATHEYGTIARDVAQATNWRERLNLVFRGPGWKPADGNGLTTEDPGFTLAS